jgi:hypothetical protein
VNSNLVRGCLTVVLGCVAWPGLGQSVAFSDDFNRTDGPVGNGWLVSNVAALNGGALQLSYSNSTRGAIYRQLPVTYPVSFGFDYRTESFGGSCGGPVCPVYGGWKIALNAPEPGNPGAQYEIYMDFLSRTLRRSVVTSDGIVSDAIETTAPDMGHGFVRIEGIIHANLNASITIAGTTYEFERPSGYVPPASYANLVLSMAGSAGHLPFVFDNFSISTDVVGPTTMSIAVHPVPLALQEPSTVTAVIDDTRSGGSSIVSASFTVDGRPPSPMSILPAGGVLVTATAPLAGFSTAGVHEVCAKGIDARGNVGWLNCTGVPVYDPSAGFVTGNGKIESVAGADPVNLQASGTAMFSFSSKYLQSNQTPSGDLSFQFKLGDLSFKSDQMEWLAVSGEPRATFRGTGTVNKMYPCKFEADVWDGSYQSNTAMNVDAFGIKIFGCVGGGFPNGYRYLIPATPLSNGSIVIHR